MAAPQGSETVLTVDDESAGLRLDLFLARRFHGLGSADGWSRAELQRWISEGQVTINQLQAKPSARLKRRDVIRLRAPSARPCALAAENIPLDAIFEDEHIIVINKSAGLMVHPATGKTTGTLVNALLYRCPGLGGIGGEQRPGIVHRLDRDTSGVMVAAKTAPAFRGLARQFKDRAVRKEYIALVWGRLPQPGGVIDRAIGRHRSDRKRMSSRYSLPKHREAVTEWQVEKLFAVRDGPDTTIWVSWLSLKPRTGRTHQLRVHLADMGHPIIGDRIYGRQRKARNTMGDTEMMLYAFPRQALHAANLTLRHPVTGALRTFHAPLPPDMSALLHDLELRAGTG